MNQTQFGMQSLPRLSKCFQECWLWMRRKMPVSNVEVVVRRSYRKRHVKMNSWIQTSEWKSWSGITASRTFAIHKDHRVRLGRYLIIFITIDLALQIRTYMIWLICILIFGKDHNEYMNMWLWKARARRYRSRLLQVSTDTCIYVWICVNTCEYQYCRISIFEISKICVRLHRSKPCQTLPSLNQVLPTVCQMLAFPANV